MSIPNACEVTGTIVDLNNNLVVGAIVRGGCYNQPVLMNDYNLGIKTDVIETVTSSSGTFSITFPQGAKVWLSIPCLGYRNDLQIPTDQTSVSFTSITPADGTY